MSSFSGAAFGSYVADLGSQWSRSAVVAPLVADDELSLVQRGRSVVNSKVCRAGAGPSARTLARARQLDSTASLSGGKHE